MTGKGKGSTPKDLRKNKNHIWSTLIAKSLWATILAFALTVAWTFVIHTLRTLACGNQSEILYHFIVVLFRFCLSEWQKRSLKAISRTSVSELLVSALVSPTALQSVIESLKSGINKVSSIFQYSYRCGCRYSMVRENNESVPTVRLLHYIMGALNSLLLSFYRTIPVRKYTLNPVGAPKPNTIQ